MKRTGGRGILPNNKELNPTLLEVFWRQMVKKQKQLKKSYIKSFEAPFSMSLSPDKLWKPVGSIFTTSFNSKAPRDTYIRDKKFLQDSAKRNLLRQINRRPIVQNRVNQFQRLPGSHTSFQIRSSKLNLTPMMKRRKSSCEKFRQLQQEISFHRHMASMAQKEYKSLNVTMVQQQ